jgi:Cu/Ag efflux protein CusF
VRKLSTLSCLLAAVLAAPAFAQLPSSGNHVAHHADAFADGEVRKVDKDAKKLTIKHGPIPNLEMPAMTMVFQVKDAQMLEQVKPGDKVRFEAQKLGGAFTVTRIEAAK